MSQTFPCGHPGCGEQVTYKPQPIRFLTRTQTRLRLAWWSSRQNRAEPVEAARVFLLCPNGHNLPYVVNR